MTDNLFSEITVYTISECENCKKAKDILERWGIEYQEVSLLPQDKEAQQQVAARTGLKSFPQILLGEQVLGGFSDLEIDQCLALDV